MKPCLAYLELMNAVLDGEATEFEVARLQAHLDTCPACAALYEDLKALRAGSDALVVPAPAGLTQAVLAQIKAESTPKIAALPKKKKANRWFPMVAAAAACALVVFGTGSLDRITGGMAEPAAPAAMAPQAYDSAAEAPVPAPVPSPYVAPSATEDVELPTGDRIIEPHTESVTEPCAPEEMPISTPAPALTVENATSLVLDWILGDIYSDPDFTVKLSVEGTNTHILMEGDDGFAEETLLSYTGLSPNEKYYCFAWTWEGQTEDDLDTFRYAVPVDECYVIWAGKSPLFDEALSE